MKVEVSRHIDVPDEAVDHVSRELQKKFPSVMNDFSSRDQREHVSYARAVAAKAIAEYLDWLGNTPRRDGRLPG